MTESSGELLLQRLDVLQQVLDVLPVGLWIMDASGRIVYGNPAAQRLWAGARYVGIEQLGEYKAWQVSDGARIAPESWADAATAWGIAMLVVVAVIGLGIAWASGLRIAPALALAWGLSWLAVGRLSGEPGNTAIGVTAIVVAAIVLLVPLAIAGLRLLRPEHD